MEEHLDVPQFGKVEVALFVKCVILKLELLNLLFEAGDLDLGRGIRGSSDGLGSHGGLGACAARRHVGLRCHLGWLNSGRLGLLIGSVNLAATCNVVQFLTLSPADRVVGLPIIVLLEIGLEPLAKL